MPGTIFYIISFAWGYREIMSNFFVVVVVVFYNFQFFFNKIIKNKKGFLSFM